MSQGLTATMRLRPACLLTLLCPLFFVSCSTQRPVLYPNEHLKRVGAHTAEQDVNECMGKGEAYVSSGARAKEVAGRAAAGAGTGAAVGGAAGAAGGAVVGSAARGAAAGAAGGAAGGATRATLRGLFQSRGPDPLFRNFVTQCLREKGYELIGWK
jgi:hypothetical protein